MATIKHYCATNCVNGNPRRVYVLFFDGEPIAAWDEGYSGSDAVPGIWRRQAYEAKRINCSARKYKQLLKLPSPAYAYEVKGYSHLR